MRWARLTVSPMAVNSLRTSLPAAVAVQRRADAADQRRAGVDADAHDQRRLPLALQVVVQPRQLGQQVQRRGHGPVGVVVTGARHAEQRHQAVAEELVDVAAVPLDRLETQREKAVEQIDDALRRLAGAAAA